MQGLVEAEGTEEACLDGLRPAVTDDDDMELLRKLVALKEDSSSVTRWIRFPLEA